MMNHPTAEALYDAVREKLPRISLGTVYRNLERLTRCGLARRLDRVGAQARFDANMGRHWHVQCTGCGRIDDVYEVELPSNAPLQSVHGFSITAIQIGFDGICPDCRARTTLRDTEGYPEAKDIKENRK
jgi:Fur family ferric uptake transcriptional regulator